MEATQNLNEKRRKLWFAEKKLQDHREFYEQDLRHCVQAPRSRCVEELKKEFDFSYLVNGTKLAGEIREAEAELQTAKKDAKVVGVWVPADQDSQFGDHPDDGYSENHERAWVSEFDRSKIEKWMKMEEGPLSHECPGTPPEIDEFFFDTNKPIDSVSAVAEGADRRRIDRYNELVRR
ncbi:hypothetical protein BU16DRAFT_462467 [Lophium mytilinum]|uniref:Uncharacterized protein n=1 Tax=Lophium mytilinum TaxID=390894 RepID=A0A6A6QR34_9PEZI|nr:hypothetical protein BU16DRAFT_462467 [Lophium mytilinum]